MCHKSSRDFKQELDKNVRHGQLDALGSMAVGKSPGEWTLKGKQDPAKQRPM